MKKKMKKKNNYDSCNNNINRSDNKDAYEEGSNFDENKNGNANKLQAEQS